MKHRPKKEKTYILLSEKHYKNIKLRIFLWLIGYKAVKDFYLGNNVMLIMRKPKYTYFNSILKRDSYG